jgi:hypothetical protein
VFVAWGEIQLSRQLRKKSFAKKTTGSCKKGCCCVRENNIWRVVDAAEKNTTIEYRRCTIGDECREDLSSGGEAGRRGRGVCLLWSVTFLIPPSIGGKTPIIINSYYNPIQ